MADRTVCFTASQSQISQHIKTWTCWYRKWSNKTVKTFETPAAKIKICIKKQEFRKSTLQGQSSVNLISVSISRFSIAFWNCKPKNHSSITVAYQTITTTIEKAVFHKNEILTRFLHVRHHMTSKNIADYCPPPPKKMCLSVHHLRLNTTTAAAKDATIPTMKQIL